MPALGAEYYFFLYVGELKLYSGALLFVSRIKKARTVIGAAGRVSASSAVEDKVSQGELPHSDKESSGETPQV